MLDWGYAITGNFLGGIRPISGWQHIYLRALPKYPILRTLFYNFFYLLVIDVEWLLLEYNAEISNTTLIIVVKSKLNDMAFMKKTKLPPQVWYKFAVHR